MAIKRFLSYRLNHTCTIERNNGTAQSATGEVQEDWDTIGTSIPCKYIEVMERAGSEVVGEVAVKQRFVLFKHDANILYNDRIDTVKDSDGNTIQASELVVDEIVARRHLDGRLHHKKVFVELVETS